MRLIDEFGNFFVGCNYWASHAGTAMWSDWRPEIVEEDLKQLSQEGVEVIRVFPLWPDFQPIKMLYTSNGNPFQYRFGEELIPDTEAGRAGVSCEAIEKFRKFTLLAEKYNIKLIVGLITGWMSGRLFVPPALEGRNVITDKTAIMWQVRFVRYFVNTFSDSSAIVAWDLGNECNCMADVKSPEEAWVWTSALSGAIKSEDASRPLISGMHSLTPKGIWQIQDQAELTDILTTHPYPFWTPYTDYDPVNTIRPLLHATAETLFYSNIGNKPCFAEETGTMGPMVCSDKISGDFARTSLLSLWAHGCHGFLWWCAYNQTKLRHAPYDWTSCERELGMIKENREVKPVLKEIAEAKKMIRRLPFGKLPPRNIDAICITNSQQDYWAIAYSAFILSKQAGFDIEYQHDSQPIREAQLYMLPCVKGVSGISKHRWEEILKKVSEGAVLYISIEDGYIADFEDTTGLRVKTRSRRISEAECIFNDKAIEPLKITSPIKLEFENIKADILAFEEDGNPVFSSMDYGKGRIFFMSLPIELDAVQKPGGYTDPKCGYYRIYSEISKGVRSRRIVAKDNPLIGVTEHQFDVNTKLAVFINYSPTNIDAPITLSKGWEVDKVLYGDSILKSDGKYILPIKANDALMLRLVR